MLNTFRTLSLVEGISLLILLFIAMPAKYQFGYTEAVLYAGMVHGVLWMGYFMMSLTVSHQKNWSVGFWLLVLFASITPLACFILDRKIREPEAVKTTV